MRRLVTVSALCLSLAPAAFAQAPAPAPAAPANPVVATVNGQKIFVSDVQAAAQDLPQQYQNMPQQQIYQMLVSQLIDRKALLAAAHKENLQANPQVAALMQGAADDKLENAYLQEQVFKQVTPAAIQAEYNKDYAGKPGPAQVDARHILVPTQAQAQDIISQLDKGADFAKLAQKYSQDPSGKSGGELGWFSQNEMVKPFADAAFALQPGKYTETPVQTQFGWHVILLEGKRQGPTPALADVQDQIQQQLADGVFKATLKSVTAKAKVTLYGPDGKPLPPAPAGQ
jgi:peptidyl-prolyl cis-trans isomerase C